MAGFFPFSKIILRLFVYKSPNVFWIYQHSLAAAASGRHLYHMKIIRTSGRTYSDIRTFIFGHQDTFGHPDTSITKAKNWFQLPYQARQPPQNISKPHLHQVKATCKVSLQSDQQFQRKIASRDTQISKIISRQGQKCLISEFQPFEIGNFGLGHQYVSRET